MKDYVKDYAITMALAECWSVVFYHGINCVGLFFQAEWDLLHFDSPNKEDRSLESCCAHFVILFACKVARIIIFSLDSGWKQPASSYLSGYSIGLLVPKTNDANQFVRRDEATISVRVHSLSFLV